jgi:Na+/melibiose symporter-like transporter
MIDANGLKVTPRTRWSFASGGVTRGVIENAHYFVLVYYSQVLGLSPYLAGLAFGIGLVFDAITDPLVGYLSDNTRSRLGRRHPYLYASVVPLALTYFLLWHPPPSIQEEMSLFFYLLICNSALNLSTTLFIVPAYATVAEITSDYEERTRLLSRFHAMMSVVGNGMSFAMYAIWLRPTPYIADGILNVEGYRQAGVFGTLLMAASILVFTIGLHRHIPHMKTHSAPGSPSPRQFYRQVYDVIRIPALRTILTSGALYWAGSGTYAALWVYIYSYFWEFTSQQISMIVVPMILGGLILPPIMSGLATGREKKRVAVFGMLGGSLVNIAPIALRLIGVFPENGTQALFWIMLTVGFFETWLFLVFDVCWRSMTSDITEQIEIATGRRNEGVIMSAVTFTSKCSYAIGTLIAGTLLSLIAFPTETAVGDVALDVIFDLGLLYGPVVLAVYLLACYAISRYDISRAKFIDTVSRLGES